MKARKFSSLRGFNEDSLVLPILDEIRFQWLIPLHGDHLKDETTLFKYSSSIGFFNNLSISFPI